MIGKCTLDCFACCLCYPVVKLFLERIQLSHLVSFFIFVLLFHLLTKTTQNPSYNTSECL